MHTNINAQLISISNHITNFPFSGLIALSEYDISTLNSQKIPYIIYDHHFMT